MQMFHSSQFGSFKADNPGMELIGEHHTLLACIGAVLGINA